MNKRALVTAVADRADLTPAAAEAAVDALVEAITSGLVSGEKIAVPGLGTFETRARAARSGRNPQTGETMQIAASTVAAFRPAPALKKAVASS